jgi:hypothetical protein
MDEQVRTHNDAEWFRPSKRKIPCPLLIVLLWRVHNKMLEQACKCVRVYELVCESVWALLYVKGLDYTESVQRCSVPMLQWCLWCSLWHRLMRCYDRGQLQHGHRHPGHIPLYLSCIPTTCQSYPASGLYCVTVQRQSLVSRHDATPWNSVWHITVVSYWMSEWLIDIWRSLE